MTQTDATDQGQMERVLSQVAGKRVVTLGGGTGPFALLSRLKRYPCSITAVVSMADSGGSSRRLMDEFGQLPFGDLRQALVALSGHSSLWRDIFGFRFSVRRRSGTEHTGISGHSLGNLIISALQDLNQGNLLQAIADAEELLNTAGHVLPVTLSHATLCAHLEDGAVIRGETEIDTRGARCSSPLSAIAEAYLEPETFACREAIQAIQRADVIILGPGDLYTSILPNLLVGGVADAIRDSETKKVYVCNLMTKHGETDGFTASRFVREILRYLRGGLDRVILHDGALPTPLLEMYAEQGQHPVTPDADTVRNLVGEVVVDDVLSIHPDHLLRHDADRLIRAIFDHESWMPAEVSHASTQTQR